MAGSGRRETGIAIRELDTVQVVGEVGDNDDDVAHAGPLGGDLRFDFEKDVRFVCRERHSRRRRRFFLVTPPA